MIRVLTDEEAAASFREQVSKMRSGDLIRYWSKYSPTDSRDPFYGICMEKYSDAIDLVLLDRATCAEIASRKRQDIPQHTRIYFDEMSCIAVMDHR